MKENVGIIGQGFVGNAVYQKFKEIYNVLTFDIIADKSNSSLDDVVKICRCIFVCLPTPMKPSGECDISFVSSAISDIALRATEEKIIIIKSTIPPYTTDMFNNISSNINVCFNPEFLTAANAVEDFKTQKTIILGGDRMHTTEVANLYERLFPQAQIIHTSGAVAEMCKYVVNTYLAVRVSYANEIFDFCEAAGIPYNDVMTCALHDERIGRSHWKVPGPDGERGFGGACFPKDINALIHEFSRAGIIPHILSAAWGFNKKIRKN